MNDINKQARKPVIFEIINFEFPSHYSIYESNIIEFWKPIDRSLVPKIRISDINRFWISSRGRVYDSYYQYIIPSNSSAGNKYYEQINLRDDLGATFTVKVHRLVLMAFMPISNPSNFQCNHINGIKNDNDLRNLEWCTGEYNRYHAILNNLEDSIYNNKIVKLYPYENRKIKELKEQGISNEQIIDILHLQNRKVYPSLIDNIANGKSKLYSRYY